MRQQFIVNTADTFKTRIYEHNRGIIPTSARLTVWHPSSYEKLIDDLAMTISSDGLLTYALGAELNNTVGLNYKAQIVYVHQSIESRATLFYDVVNSRLTSVITDEDLISELPQLMDNGYRHLGTASAGTASTIVDAELGRFDDHYFTGGLAYVARLDEKREIIGFESSTGTVTTESFSGTIAADDAYVLTRSFAKETRRAFEKIEGMLLKLGKRPELLMDALELREAHIYASVAEVCKSFVATNSGLWWELWKVYEEKAQEAISSLTFKYDASNDGFISAFEEGESAIRTRIARG